MWATSSYVFGKDISGLHKKRHLASLTENVKQTFGSVISRMQKYTGHETAPLGKHVANNLKDICRRFMAIMLPDLAYRVVAAPFFPA